MNSAFLKNLIRDIKKTFSRFLSIAAIIAVGVAFYSGVRATSPDMKRSGDLYFTKSNFMDFRIISTLGLTNNDVVEIGKIPGISEAEGANSLDAVIERKGRSEVINLNTIHQKTSINRIKIIKGRMPEDISEAVVEEKLLKNEGLQLGDMLTLKSGNDTNLSTRLKNTSFKIVGTAFSPLYISGQRQLSPVGNGQVKGFVYVVPEAFQGNIYTEAYVKTSSRLSDSSLENHGDYNEFVKLVEKSIKDKKRPESYVLGRTANVGYETYRQDSDRIDNIGKVFPLIFFLVASLVSLTTMSRMVQDRRMEIGVFKALGYSDIAVISHYLIYALSASVIGSLIGISVGFRLFPSLIMNAYSSLYYIPDRAAPFNTQIALQASLIAVLFVSGAAVLSALDEIREVPSSLMRPKSPKLGKRVFLEGIPLLWRSLGFTGKITARNIFRYKQRLLMTVTGIAACTALMITGYGIREGITGATEKQFNKIYKYDMQASLDKSVAETEKKSIKTKAEAISNIRSMLFSYMKNVSVHMGGSKTQDVYLVVPEDSNSIKDYIALSINGKEIDLKDNGVILTQKLARMLGKKTGDTVKLNLGDKTMDIVIAGITEHYIQHYIYMSPVLYKKLMGNEADPNSFYGLLNNTTQGYQDETARALKSIRNVNSVAFRNNIQIDYGESMESVSFVVLILIASAGVLAFVVIYNLTNINIAERKRELATIKLLGFYNIELAAYIYRENTILTMIGTGAGVLLGKIMNGYILLSAETNSIMFLNEISFIYFMYSILLTIGFSMIVNLAMYSGFSRIDMIESLKSVE